MKSIITIVALFVSLNVFAGGNDSTLYQYRIGIKDVTTLGSAKLVQEPLFDLFETKPEYQEAIQTFVFTSKVDVDTIKVRQVLQSTAYTEVTYFRKEKIK